jgi:PII-like signaling protein
MKGTYLKLYVPEFEKHPNGEALHQWLMNSAKSLGMQGGTATRGVSGFGRHGDISVDNVFGESPMEMAFMTSEELADKFLNLLKKEKLTLFYIKTPAEYGWLGELQK